MRRATILLVDDTPENVQLLAHMLSKQGHQVRPTNSAERALEALRDMIPDIILLDIAMPVMNGYQLCEVIKQNEKWRDIPVIFISALDGTFDKVHAFEVGAVDYITKPFRMHEVLARVGAHLRIHWQQQEIKMLREQETAYLKQINRLKDDVLAIVSHDLKNPLGAMIAYGELIQLEFEDNGMLTADRAELFAGMRRVTQKMQYLVHDLLDLARIEGQVDLTHRAMPLNDYLEHRYREFLPAAQKKQLVFQYVPIEPDVEVFLDPNRFEQALDNLLSNAIKYTPDGGTVTLSAERSDTTLTIRIRDTGLGIPPEAIPHLFEKFYRVNLEGHRQQAGSGLGLAIVKAVVEQHLGTVSVESELGQGTTFSVTIPIRPANIQSARIITE